MAHNYVKDYVKDEEEKFTKNMSDGEVLKWQVFKVDFEMLRYFAMYENYQNCFEENGGSECLQMTPEQTFLNASEYLKMTPEQAFLNACEYWTKLDDSNLWEEVVSNWGMYTVNEYWFHWENREQIKKIVDGKINEIKKTLDSTI